MSNMVQYAKLTIPVPILEIKKEVLQIKQSWQHHFNKMNYEGEWTVLSLRAAGGRSEEIIPDQLDKSGYADTLLMKEYPFIKKLVDFFHCPVLAVRLMNLKAGSIIKEHRDAELSFEHGETRLHIPVFTNEKVAFWSEDHLLSMKEGECWYVNVNRPHKVSNEGCTDRIHLVIDCQVNEWLKELFLQSECTYVSRDKLDPQLIKIIHELRLQNTETANNLANNLERQLRTKQE